MEANAVRAAPVASGPHVDAWVDGQGVGEDPEEDGADDEGIARTRTQVKLFSIFTNSTQSLFVGFQVSTSVGFVFHLISYT